MQLNTFSNKVRLIRHQYSYGHKKICFPKNGKHIYSYGRIKTKTLT